MYFVKVSLKPPHPNIPPAKHKQLLSSAERVLNVDAVEISDLSWKSCCKVIAPLVYLAKHYYDPKHMKDLKLWEKVCVVSAFERNCSIRKQFNMMIKPGNHAMLRCAKAFIRNASRHDKFEDTEVYIRACKRTLEEIDRSGQFRRKIESYFA